MICKSWANTNTSDIIPGKDKREKLLPTKSNKTQKPWTRKTATHNTETMYNKSCHSQSRQHRNHGQEKLPPTKGKPQKPWTRKAATHNTQHRNHGQENLPPTSTSNRNHGEEKLLPTKHNTYANRTHIACRDGRMYCICIKPRRPRRPKMPTDRPDGPNWPPDGPRGPERVSDRGK